MGNHVNISTLRFPKQGENLGKRVECCFNYVYSNTVDGVVLRDDIEEPFLTIISLDNGRHILGTECQFRPHE